MGKKRAEGLSSGLCVHFFFSITINCAMPTIRMRKEKFPFPISAIITSITAASFPRGHEKSTDRKADAVCLPAGELFV